MMQFFFLLLLRGSQGWQLMGVGGGDEEFLPPFSTIFLNKFSGVGMRNPHVGNDFSIPTTIHIYLFYSKDKYLILIN